MARASADRHLTDRLPFLVATFAILVSLLLVRPFGDYPIGDDWTFALPLRHLLEDGELRILDFTPMTLVAHLAWGALVSLPFGFSFDVARLSTVLLLVVEVRAVLAMLEDIGVSSGLRTAAALALVFQPIHFFQSFQFASDVPCAAWTALALLSYSRGLASGDAKGSAGERLRWLAAGGLFAALAFGVRQPGILVAAAAGLYLLAFEPRRLVDLRVPAAAFAIPAAAVAAWSAWYFGARGPTGAYLDVSSKIASQLANVTPAGLASVVWCTTATLASFVVPIALATRLTRVDGRRRVAAIAAVAAVAALFAFLTFGYGTLYPYMRNNVTAFGLLSPNEMILGDRVAVWPRGAAWVATALVVAALARIAWMLAAVRVRTAAPALRLAIVLAAIQLAYFIATSGFVLDRHLLQMLPAFVVILAGGSDRATVRWTVFVPLAAVSAFYAIACTHDWHAVSRTASLAARELMADGIDARYIDAGYAETGWQMYDRSEAELRRGEASLVRDGDSWWVGAIARRVETRYVVSLSPTMSASRWEAALPWWAWRTSRAAAIDAYAPYREYRYATWWPAGEQTLHVLRDTRIASAREGLRDAREP